MVPDSNDNCLLSHLKKLQKLVNPNPDLILDIDFVWFEQDKKTATIISQSINILL